MNLVYTIYLMVHIGAIYNQSVNLKKWLRRDFENNIDIDSLY